MISHSLLLPEPEITTFIIDDFTNIIKKKGNFIVLKFHLWKTGFTTQESQS